ncbi:MAG: hypothetical protein HQL16_07095 [Candidatus Omnitrophica bacterium]|nr:hypothetical protein [Candidatus Omnitrophota bacterium]
MVLVRVVIVLLLMACLTGNIVAQESPEPTTDSIVLVMKKALQLNDGQTREVKAAVEEQLRQIRQLKSERLDAESMKRQMAILGEDFNSKLENYLTPEQMRQWKTKPSQPQNNTAAPLADATSGVLTSTGGVLESSHPGKVKTSGIW